VIATAYTFAELLFRVIATLYNVVKSVLQFSQMALFVIRRERATVREEDLVVGEVLSSKHKPYLSLCCDGLTAACMFSHPIIALYFRHRLASTQGSLRSQSALRDMRRYLLTKTVCENTLKQIRVQATSWRIIMWCVVRGIDHDRFRAFIYAALD
jgi:hypothetical protein